MMKVLGRTWRPCVLTCWALVSSACYPAASESARLDMVRKQAALDMECHPRRLTIERDVGFNYLVRGCGKRSYQEVVCSGGECRAEGKLLATPPEPGGLPQGITGGRRIVNAGAVDEDLPLPNRLSPPRRAYAGAFRICVGPTGAVSEAQVVESTGEPEVDELWLEKVRTWRFEPYRQDGGDPVPFCATHQLILKRSRNPPVDELGPEPPVHDLSL
jgi:TonB family protein